MSGTRIPGRRPVLAAATGVIAVSAYGGAVALTTGVIDLGRAIDERLPFGSPLLAGIALALVVAVPMTVASHRAATGRYGAGLAAVIAGASLVGWIFVEVVVIRTFSWLQPTMAAAGAAVLIAGLTPRGWRSA